MPLEFWSVTHLTLVILSNPWFYAWIQCIVIYQVEKLNTYFNIARIVPDTSKLERSGGGQL
jgi:hypothetical protein